MMLVPFQILMVGYYQYPHLYKLLPMISNDDQEKQDFCDIGILTIDYDCALHIDNNSISNLDAYFRQKLGLLSISTYLNDYQRE